MTIFNDDTPARVSIARPRQVAKEKDCHRQGRISHNELSNVADYNFGFVLMIMVKEM